MQSDPKNPSSPNMITLVSEFYVEFAQYVTIISSETFSVNFKWSDGGEEVKWHQDIQFWPHTNYSPLTIGVYLNDVTDEMAPMGVIPSSHKRALFDLVDDNGQWTGAVSDKDLKTLYLDRAEWLKGPAGSVTVHSCRMVLGSAPNSSPQMRPLLLHTFSAGDA